jgi:hypothetical protein
MAGISIAARYGYPLLAGLLMVMESLVKAIFRGDAQVAPYR